MVALPGLALEAGPAVLKVALLPLVDPAETARDVLLDLAVAVAA